MSATSGEIVFLHDYAEVNGVRLHYAHAGAGNERLIVFLHGFPEFWYAWKEQLALFGRDDHAVAPDMRGYNLSSKPAEVEAYRVRHVGEDIRALAEHLGHRRFVLVGHDWGGAVAWAMAINRPEHLERLVIVNAPHPAVFARELRQNPAQQRASGYMLTLRGPEAEGLLAADGYRMLLDLLRGWGERRAWLTKPDRAAYVEAWSQPGALTGGLNYYRASALGPPTGAGATSGNADAATANPDPAALTARVPTLVIWGERDSALLTGNLDGLDAFVPDLTVQRVPDGSHWVVHEHPDTVNAAIRRFITDPA